mmetsp:Transcript_55549/g.92005  ORF Transcript_55549/g.92005 Transcript_55549/m.92005 type:complete len:484 (-) Transcript_55549:178-1629(-)
MNEVAVLLHGRLGLWSASATDIQRHSDAVVSRNIPKGMLRQMSPLQRAQLAHSYDITPGSTMSGFVRFAHASIWRHVVLANRAAGLMVAVFLHSWHPELTDLLDTLYEAEASRHDVFLPELSPLRSQHLSLARGMQLVARGEKARKQLFKLVFVGRYDLLFLADLVLAPMLTPLSKVTLALPHWCKVARVNASEQRVLAASCGYDLRRWRPKAHFSGSGYVERQPTGIWGDVVLGTVLDWWFVGSSAVAASFGELHQKIDLYQKQMRATYPSVPEVAHYYWAHHIRVANLTVRHVLWEGIDFTLARNWWIAISCHAPAARADARRIGRIYREYGSLPGRVTAQCPNSPYIKDGVRLRCLWNAPACGSTLATRVLSIDASVRHIMNRTTRLRPPRQTLIEWAHLPHRPLQCRIPPLGLAISNDTSVQGQVCKRRRSFPLAPDVATVRRPLMCRPMPFSFALQLHYGNYARQGVVGIDCVLRQQY